MAIIIDQYVEESEELVMADDGTGHSLTIPSFIIKKVDGDLIKQYLNGGEFASDQTFVYMKGEIEIIHHDNRVEYELWYSSIFDLDEGLIRDLALY